MQIGILGTGRMGTALDDAMRHTDHSIVFRCNEQRPLTLELAARADAIIDFTTASAVAGNAEMALQHKVPFVTGTTGWENQRATIRKLVQQYNGSFLYAANFSIGVALFRIMALQAARLFDSIGGYDFGIHEIHHTGKADSPSGTALLLGETMLKNISGKTKIDFGNTNGKISSEVLQITSQRTGAIPGTHRIFITSPEDSIELAHIAHGRSAFAAGSIRAVEWLSGRTGFFTLDDMLADILPSIN